MVNDIYIHDLTRSEQGEVLVFAAPFSFVDFQVFLQQAFTSGAKGAHLTFFLTAPEIFPSAEELFIFPSAAPREKKVEKNSCESALFLLPTANLYLVFCTKEENGNVVSKEQVWSAFFQRLKFLACRAKQVNSGLRPGQSIGMISWSQNIDDWLPLLDLVVLKQLICEVWADILCDVGSSREPDVRRENFYLNERFLCPLSSQVEKGQNLSLSQQIDGQFNLQALPDEETTVLIDETAMARRYTENKATYQELTGEIDGALLGRAHLRLQLDARCRITQTYFQGSILQQGEVGEFLQHLQGKPGQPKFLKDFTRLYAASFVSLFYPPNVEVSSREAYLQEWLHLFTSLFKS